MENHVWHIGKKILGTILIVGGLLGLFLPFLQGVAMIIAGAILLDNQYITGKARAFIKWLRSFKWSRTR